MIAPLRETVRPRAVERRLRQARRALGMMLPSEAESSAEEEPAVSPRVAWAIVAWMGLVLASYGWCLFRG